MIKIYKTAMLLLLLLSTLAQANNGVMALQEDWAAANYQLTGQPALWLIKIDTKIELTHYLRSKTR